MNKRLEKKQILNKLQTLDTKQGDFLIVRYPFGTVSFQDLMGLYSSLKSKLPNVEIFCIPDDTDLRMSTRQDLIEIREQIDKLLLKFN